MIDVRPDSLFELAHGRLTVIDRRLWQSAQIGLHPCTYDGKPIGGALYMPLIAFSVDEDVVGHLELGAMYRLMLAGVAGDLPAGAVVLARDLVVRQVVEATEASGRPLPNLTVLLEAEHTDALATHSRIETELSANVQVRPGDRFGCIALCQPTSIDDGAWLEFCRTLPGFRLPGFPRIHPSERTPW